MAEDAVVPDTKDSTWVLSEPCPECGLDAATLDATSVAAMVRDNAAGWLQVLARSDVRRRPADDVWSPLEYGCHVRDVHRVFDQRLERMLAEDDPSFDNWDQDRTAREERYGEQDPTAVAAQLLAAATTIADRFDGVPGDQWERAGRRSGGARFTVRTLAQYAAHDWVHHLHDVGGPAA